MCWSQRSKRVLMKYRTKDISIRLGISRSALKRNKAFHISSLKLMFACGDCQKIVMVDNTHRWGYKHSGILSRFVGYTASP